MKYSSMGTDEEVDQLFNILNAEDIRPDKLESGFKDFSVESKNELVARIARTFDPPPQGRLLARLLFILTNDNKSDMVTALIANLRSPYPEARKASLYGLDGLEHPGIVDFALNSLRDNSDQVLVAASAILLSKARQDVRVWKLLQGFYAIHKDKEEFYGVTTLLEAHGINRPDPIINSDL